MTKDDIIKAAFKVWGRDLYRTTSLTQIALELGVSKPALYRHFKDKNALLSAMDTAYFDDCAGFIKAGYDRAVSTEDRHESDLIIMRTISEYYIRNMDAFIFSLTRVYDSRNREITNAEFILRGINFGLLTERKKGASFYPSGNQLVIATIVYCIAQFHRGNDKPRETPAEDDVKRILVQIENLIIKGLELDAGKVASLDFRLLEEQATRSVPDDTEENALLRAVAEAVAEAGPWNASMEMVARRSGLSKSGLYAHFKNRQDMLGQLFIAEFTRIVNFAKIQIETSNVPEEQLYMAIMAIVNYLRSRPEILTAMDWIKTRNLDLGKEVPARLYRIIHDIKLEAIQKYDQHLLVWIAQWILFLIINALAWWPGLESSAGSDKNLSYAGPGESKNWAKNVFKVPNECFHILFNFIALGLGGLNNE